MKERPILFSASMVRAILDGRKSMTRRVMKPQPDVSHWQGIQAMHGTTPDGHAFGDPRLWRVVGPDYPDDSRDNIRCPYAIGRRLWVRETIRKTGEFPGGYATSEYVADGTPTVADAWPWQRCTLAAIHCPRGLSRILLEVTDVRVQRVQDISQMDALDEGIDTEGDDYNEGEKLQSAGSPVSAERFAFACLWDSINDKRGFGWNANPWVWALTFKRMTEAAR